MDVSNVSAIAVTKLWALSLRALSPNSRFHWIYLVSAFLIAVGVYWISRKRGERRTLAQVLFPRSVWLHPSAVADYLFVALVISSWTLLLAPQLISATRISQELLAIANYHLGPAPKIDIHPMAIAVLYTVALTMATDLKRYWIHRLMHRVPMLWEFHKVHHSAEVLTPVTFYRSHPVDMFIEAIAEAMVLGVVTAAFVFLFPLGLTLITVLGVNVFRFAFYVCGAHLRHSHIWLSFGPAAEHVFISPAQHQIHHSSDPKHFDRNFGSELSLWDWLFGTLYIPQGPEKLTFGLGESENRRLSTVRQLLINPFRALGKYLANGRVGSFNKT